MKITINQYKKEFFNTIYPGWSSYEDSLRNKFLIPLIIKIWAYEEACKRVALDKFCSNNVVKSLDKFFSEGYFDNLEASEYKERGFYKKEDREKLRKEVEKSFESSIDQKEIEAKRNELIEVSDFQKAKISKTKNKNFKKLLRRSLDIIKKELENLYPNEKLKRMEEIAGLIHLKPVPFIAGYVQNVIQKYGEKYARQFSSEWQEQGWIPKKLPVAIGEEIKAKYSSICYLYGKKEAKKLIQEFNLTEDQVKNIQRIAFNEILRITNSKLRTVKLPSIIRTLEEAIEIQFPKWLQDLGFEPWINLITLRKENTNKPNTVCWRCGKPLIKKDNKHYCSRRENRPCVETRPKEEGERERECSVILRTKNKCEWCGKDSPSNYIIKHKGEWRQFCSKKCYNAFRQAGRRKRKKN